MAACSDNSLLNENNPPNAEFSFSPEMGDTSTVFTFSASKSNDLEDANNALLFRWDFEGNYFWTDPVVDPTINYKFSMPRNYNVGLCVIDTEEWSDEARKNVIVTN
ncbi:MAG: hypothetical protein H8E34_04915 [Bacteroidetes bacterium]|nr:hypothetical protein [Bacteroidota bacterium]MBL6944439.1 hypothetical protein [Bacteroidales bacterium]